MEMRYGSETTMLTLAALTRTALILGFPTGIARNRDGTADVFILLPDGKVTWPISTADLVHFAHLQAIDVDHGSVPRELSEKRLAEFTRRRDTKPMQAVKVPGSGSGD